MKIKSLLLAFFLAFVLFSNQSNAQSFQQDRHYLSLSYGFGNFANSLIRVIADESDITNFKYNTLGPVFVKYEYAISPKFGFGANIAYLSGNGSFNRDNNSSTTDFIEFSRVAYNINMRFS